MRTRLQTLIFAALAVVGVAAFDGPAKAAVVVDPSVGGDFIFAWTDGAGPIDFIYQEPNWVAPAVWEMTVVQNSILSVATATDCCIAGDQFDLIFNGAVVAWDSVTQVINGSDPILGSLNGNYQYSIFDLFLGAGTHTFSLNVSQSVATPGHGLMSFGPAVITHNPLPASLPLFGTGLVVFGYLGWRRHKKVAAAA